jgi:TctA family transporter
MEGTSRFVLIAVLILALLTIAGCAAGPTRFVDHPAGFWAGLWHGFIIVITFVIGLFAD